MNTPWQNCGNLNRARRYLLERIPGGWPAALALAALCSLGAGCSQTMPDRDQRMSHGYVYYLDGAGGGGIFSNWSGGLRQGLIDSGYPGAGEIFAWNTGMGVVADQDSSVDYKRAKAGECAQRIRKYSSEHPGAPVTLIGLSAGTAVTMFTLEALPASCPVENVILCGASIAADYDLTKAMQRVRNRMYVFTSENDAVLSFLVPMAGTADREHGVPSAGLRGFQVPPRASPATADAYAKVAYIRWKPEFRQYGDFGGHTDALKAPFVRHCMAPLIMAGMARSQPMASAGGKVPNPDYERWSRFGPGSYVKFEGYQLMNNVKQPLQMTVRLVSKHEERLVIERTYVLQDGGTAPVRVQRSMLDARIAPNEHPLTSPTAKISELEAETITISGKPVQCRVRSVKATGEFPEYGRNVSATLSQSDSLPGSMARVWLTSNKGDQPFEFRGTVIACGTR